MNVKTLILFPFIVLFLFVVQYPQSGSLGGSDFGVATNIIFSLGLTVLFSIVISFLLQAKRINLSIEAIFFIFLGLYSLVNFYLLPSSSDSYAMFALAIVASFLMIFCVNNFSAQQKKILLCILLLSVLLQAGLGLSQLYFPEYYQYYKILFDKPVNVPVGVFYQQNVFASYMCTGISIAIYFIITRPRWASRYYYTPMAIAYITILIAPALILLTSSRTALLSLFLIFVASGVYVLLVRKNVKHYVSLLTLCVLSFFIVINYPPDNSVLTKIKYDDSIGVEDIETQTDVDVDESVLTKKLIRNSDIRTVIYSDTIGMLIETPLLGVGYGNFYPSFIKYANSINSKLQGEPLKHPHNIFLYLWASTGLGVIALIGFYLVFFIIRQCRIKREWLVNLPVIWILTPIGLHSLLELPFNHSMLHLMAFCIFIGLLKTKRFVICSPQFVTKLLTLMVVLCSIFWANKFQNSLAYAKLLQGFDAVPISQTKVNVAAILDIVELDGFGLQDQKELRYYNAVFYKVMQTSDKKLAYQYSIWARKRVKTMPTAVLYYNIAYSFYLLGDEKSGLEYYNLSLDFFPNDVAYPKLQKMVDAQK